MLTKNIFLAALVAYVAADPVPAVTPQATTASFLSGASDLSSQLASISSLQSVLSGRPTLPASVQSYVLTAVPTTFTSVTDACALNSKVNWLATAPAYVISAYSSYATAIQSWYSVHSADLGITASYSYTGTYATYIPTNTCLGEVVSTGKSSASTKATGSSATVKSTGSAATSSATQSGGSSSTASGTAAASTGSSAAASKNGEVALSLVGVVGVLGFIAVL